MKKLLFIPLFLLSLLAGCKGGPGDTPDVPEQFDIDKINFDYKVCEGYEEYKGLELYRKISNDKEHYFFYIENCTKGGIKVLYGDEVLGTMDDYYELKCWGSKDNPKTKLVDKYFNLDLNIEEPETFKDYTYEFEKLGNKIYFIILPTIRPSPDNHYYFPHEKFIESDDYPLYYSDDEKDIHIGFTLRDNLLKPNCIKGVYNYTDLTNKNNAKYCVPVPFCLKESLSLDNYDLEVWGAREWKKITKDIIGLEYEYISDLYDDYEWVEKILDKNEDISSYNSRFNNPDFNETHYNYIKNHGTAFNISFDKLSFKGIYDEYYKNYDMALIVNINSVELYELDNEKYVPTVLSERNYPNLYENLKKQEVDIKLESLEISPYENKILGWNYREYLY